METTWRVMQVTEKPGVVEAVLQRVEWFRKNPAFVAAMEDESVQELPEEFIDCQPGDEGADTIVTGGTLKIDVSDGPDLHPMDDVVMSLRVLTTVDA